jgi:tRNA-splicing ligase RtcB
VPVGSIARARANTRPTRSGQSRSVRRHPLTARTRRTHPTRLVPAASWTSCAHGAGWRYSRTQAKKLFSPAALAEQMSGKVWLADRAERLVDEIPSASKDIDRVMADQADLVEVQHTLHQVLNYKGT